MSSFSLQFVYFLLRLQIRANACQKQHLSAPHLFRGPVRIPSAHSPKTIAAFRDECESEHAHLTCSSSSNNSPGQWSQREGSRPFLSRAHDFLDHHHVARPGGLQQLLFLPHGGLKSVGNSSTADNYPV